MFVFGHMGIGSKIVSPWAERLPRRWLLFGTILPDLIDKCVYYGMTAVTHLHGAELGLISGTRTFGHTAIFLLLVTLAAMASRSAILAAISWGVATHLLLDNLGDRILGFHDSAAFQALIFPLHGFHFAVIPFGSLVEHLHALDNEFIIGCEVIGAFLLAWDWWKTEHRKEIVAALRGKRLPFRQ